MVFIDNIGNVGGAVLDLLFDDDNFAWSGEFAVGYSYFVSASFALGTRYRVFWY